jgi:hypothetical protein
MQVTAELERAKARFARPRPGQVPHSKSAFGVRKLACALDCGSLLPRLATITSERHGGS